MCGGGSLIFWLTNHIVTCRSSRVSRVLGRPRFPDSNRLAEAEFFEIDPSAMVAVTAKNSGGDHQRPGGPVQCTLVRWNMKAEAFGSLPSRHDPLGEAIK
jgi:hypothetical protein